MEDLLILEQLIQLKLPKAPVGSIQLHAYVPKVVQQQVVKNYVVLSIDEELQLIGKLGMFVRNKKKYKNKKYCTSNGMTYTTSLFRTMPIRMYNVSLVSVNTKTFFGISMG